MTLSSDASKVIFSILSAYSKSIQIILFTLSSLEIDNSYLVAKLPENRGDYTHQFLMILDIIAVLC